jgi:hypothetical protein
MKSTTLKMGFAAIALGLMAWPGCTVSTSSTTESTTTAAPAATPEPAASEEIGPGEYCYSYKDETLSLTASLNYEGGKITGTLWGDVQDKENSYFTTYTTTFEGVRDHDRIDVSTKTEIEGDVQEEQASYIWDGKTLTEGEHKMTQVDCEPAP